MGIRIHTSHLIHGSHLCAFFPFPGNKRGFDSLWRFCSHTRKKQPALNPAPSPFPHSLPPSSSLVHSFFCQTDRPTKPSRPWPFSVKKFAKLAWGVQSLRFTALSGRPRRKKCCPLWTVHSDLSSEVTFCVKWDSFFLSEVLRKRRFTDGEFFGGGG